MLIFPSVICSPMDFVVKTYVWTLPILPLTSLYILYTHLYTQKGSVGKKINNFSEASLTGWLDILNVCTLKTHRHRFSKLFLQLFSKLFLQLFSTPRPFTTCCLWAPKWKLSCLYALHVVIYRYIPSYVELEKKKKNETRIASRSQDLDFFLLLVPIAKVDKHSLVGIVVARPRWASESLTGLELEKKNSLFCQPVRPKT